MRLNDGDKALVVQDETLLKVANRDMVGIVPLYYEMSKAEDNVITSDKLYEALTSAYKANIGIISNEITKIWNSEQPNTDAVKWLCLLNNFTIDYAKTLFMPERPSNIDEQLKVFSKMKLPHFFKFAKDKSEGQIDEMNDSTVNKLYNIIPNKPIQFKKIAGDYNYRMLMNNKRVIENQEIIDKFVEINRSKLYLMNDSETNMDSSFNKYLKNELLKISKNESYISDVLVSYLFKKNSKSKETLWKCYGSYLYNNLVKNLEGTICCDDCGKRVKGKINEKLCTTCKHERVKESKRNYKKGRTS